MVKKTLLFLDALVPFSDKTIVQMSPAFRDTHILSSITKGYALSFLKISLF